MFGFSGDDITAAAIQEWDDLCAMPGRVVRAIRAWFRRRAIRRYREDMERPYVSAYDRKQSEVRAARMGGNSPQAWRGK